MYNQLALYNTNLEGFEEPFPNHPVFRPILKFAQPEPALQPLQLNLANRLFISRLNPAGKEIKKKPNRKGMKYRRRNEGYSEAVLRHYFGELPPSE